MVQRTLSQGAHVLHSFLLVLRTLLPSLASHHISSRLASYAPLNVYLIVSEPRRPTFSSQPFSFLTSTSISNVLLLWANMRTSLIDSPVRYRVPVIISPPTPA